MQALWGQSPVHAPSRGVVRNLQSDFLHKTRNSRAPSQFFIWERGVGEGGTGDFKVRIWVNKLTTNMKTTELDLFYNSMQNLIDDTDI